MSLIRNRARCFVRCWTCVVKAGVLIVIVLGSFSCSGTGSEVPPSPQPPAPTSSTWGAAGDRRAIQQAMLSGTAAQVAATIDLAKQHRGQWLGCATEVVPGSRPDPTAVPDETVIQVWNAVHAVGFTQPASLQPMLARTTGAVALGGWYARVAGATIDLASLTTIAQQLAGAQYTPANSSTGTARPYGAYGYVHVPASDPWYLGAAQGALMKQVQATAPGLFATYDGGPFAGKIFLVNDVDSAQKIWDGGIAFDHGWAGVTMIETAIQHPDPAMRAMALQSALDAGAWALSEPCIANHNYTAKLVWLLAELYARTGDVRFRDGMIDKLQRDVMPGILMDRNGDGIVDGTDRRFADLVSYARIPGRMWDGHNTLPWYHAMNAVGLVEAYVALRDRGDAALAAEVRPYAFAMLDNLAAQLTTTGCARTTVGFSELPVPLLLALWKIADVESEAHPTWEAAAWVLWNEASGGTFGRFTVSAALFYARAQHVPHVPLRLRMNN